MKNDPNVVTAQVDLPRDEAWALAELCKRIGYSDCQQLAADRDELYAMLRATETVRSALALAGGADVPGVRLMQTTSLLRQTD